MRSSYEFIFYIQTQESPNYTGIPTGNLDVHQLIKGNSSFWINSESAVKKLKKLILNLWNIGFWHKEKKRDFINLFIIDMSG